MVIMFVCMGNTYRSRLAEVYAKSLQAPGLTFVSAGVDAKSNMNGPITPIAMQITAEYHFEAYSKPNWSQLTQGQLDKAAIVICMNRLVQEAGLRAGYKFPLRTMVWSIADVDQLIRDFPNHPEKIPPVAHKTFGEIQQHVDELLVYLRRPRSKEMVDTFLADGTPTGRKTDIDSIHTKGLWHHGVHAAIVTADRQALFEKRSSSIIGNPGLWDFSFGGIVASGETPDQALGRELHEELGLRLDWANVNPLFIARYNHYLPHYGLHNKVFIHTYLITLERKKVLRLQKSEVAAAKFLPLTEAKRFINRGDSELGQVIPAHQYYHKLFAAIM